MSVSQRDDITAAEQFEALIDRRATGEVVTIVPRQCSDSALKTCWISSDLSHHLEDMR